MTNTEDITGTRTSSNGHVPPGNGHVPSKGVSAAPDAHDFLGTLFARDRLAAEQFEAARAAFQEQRRCTRDDDDKTSKALDADPGWRPPAGPRIPRAPTRCPVPSPSAGRWS